MPNAIFYLPLKKAENQSSSQTHTLQSIDIGAWRNETRNNHAFTYKLYICFHAKSLTTVAMLVCTFGTFRGEIAFLLSSGELQEKGARILWHICKSTEEAEFHFKLCCWFHTFAQCLVLAVFVQIYSSIGVRQTSWIVSRTLTELDLLTILERALNYCNFCSILKCAGG